MLGAITGDAIGSVYEFDNTKDYDFALFTGKSNYTDDSVMTAAVANWLLKDKEHSYQGLEDSMLEFAEKYPCPMGGYGGGFHTWLFHPEKLYSYDYRYGQPPYQSKTGRHPYGSWGNGSAMRASAVGWFFDTLEETERVAEISAAITHNHPEGIKGAQATAAAVWLARNGKGRDEMRDYLSKRFGYDLDKTYQYWHPIYGWESSCQGTVPQAIICFLESKTFEDAIRKAVSLGGDSDTLACITGAIAEAYYGGVPKKIAMKVLDMLPEQFLDLMRAMQEQTAYGEECPIDDYRVVSKMPDRFPKLLKAKQEQKANKDGGPVDNSSMPEIGNDVQGALTMWTMGLGNSAKRFNGENPIPKKERIATKNSMDLSPMPEKHITVPLDLKLTDEQMAIILCGHIPDAMEDHWFMYCSDNKIHYHRSWTGICVFEAGFHESFSGFQISSLTINQDPEDCRIEPERATALFCALLMEECGGDASKYWKQYMSAR